MEMLHDTFETDRQIPNDQGGQVSIQEVDMSDTASSQHDRLNQKDKPFARDQKMDNAQAPLIWSDEIPITNPKHEEYASRTQPLHMSQSGLRTLYRRVGKTVLVFVSGGTLVILAVVAFWGFLWFSNEHNGVWYYIVAHDHLKVILTATAEAVSLCVTCMLGVCCALIVAIALERGEVLFPSLVAASNSRSGIADREISMMWNLLRNKSGTNLRYPWIALLTVLVSLLFLFSSAIHSIIISDIQIGQIPLRGVSSRLNYGFAYQNGTMVSQGGQHNLLIRTSAWNQKAPFYPTFAEYHEEPIVQDGVSDTGMTLRAFLPFSDPLLRQTIHSYSGRTTVLDSRVTCQVPVFSNLTIGYQNSLLLGGLVGASRTTPRIGNVTRSNGYVSGQLHRFYEEPAPFFCISPLFNSSTFGLPDQWRTILCQLGENPESEGEAGGLVSEFKDYDKWLATARNFTTSYQFGTAYLVMNVSSGIDRLWEGYVSSSTVSLSQQDGYESGEWLQFSLPYDLSFGVTLCYSAFDTADIAVNITSALLRNRTEPNAKFNFGNQRYTFDEIRKQYGQDQQATLEERGLMSLQRQSWIADPDGQYPVEPYLRRFSSLNGPNLTATDVTGALDFGPSDLGNKPFFSGLLWDARTDAIDVYGINASMFPTVRPFIQNTTNNPYPDWSGNLKNPDLMHHWLFQDIVSNGGSIAFALQSLITLLSSIAYYDQLPQFDNHADIVQSFYVETNIPSRTHGFTGVVVVLVFHILLTWGILLWFLVGTEYTLLGQSWNALAQMVTDETRPWIEKVRGLTDDEVEVLMRTDEAGKDLSRARVRLGEYGENGQVGIYPEKDEWKQERKGRRLRARHSYTLEAAFPNHI